MAPKSGISAQMMVATETTYGTFQTPTVGYPFLSETVTNTLERLESAGIIAGKRVLLSQQWNGGNTKVGGAVQMELNDRGMSTLFKHMFGGIATTGTGPYVHTITPGNIDGQSLTVQFGRPNVSGTVTPFSYLGAKITDWELACKAGEIATLGLTVLAQSETTGSALAIAAYSAGTKPVKFNHATVTTFGGTQVPITMLSIKAANNLTSDERRFLGSQLLSEPLEKDLRSYTFEADIEFTDTTMYGLYTAGTEVALVVTFTVGSNIVAITGNVRLDGDTPNVAGRSILTQKVTGKFIASGGTDSTALQIVITDTVATP